jgi:hypothetical protein
MEPMSWKVRFRFAVCAAAAICASAAEPPALSGPLATSERWPQATTLVDWTRDVMRIEGLEKAPETAQGKAFFEWLRLFCRMAVGGMIHAWEGPYNQERYITDAHKTLFVYGWGFCDTCSRIGESAWKEYKADPAAAERVVVENAGGGFHTMYRLRLDGRYGAFDPRYGYYLVEEDAPGARVLDWAEVGGDENFHRNRTFAHRSRPFFEVFGTEWKRALALRPVYFESEPAWRKAGAPAESVFGNSQYRMGTAFHDMNFRLPRGTAIERFWDNTARKFYQPAAKSAQREHPFLPSGRFYRVTEKSLNGNWPKYDPNYRKAEPYLVTVPESEGYDPELAGGRTIGQAWGRIRYEPNLARADLAEITMPGSDLVHSSAAPFLRPRDLTGGGEAIFDFYSPYILVDGTLESELSGGGDARLEMRTLSAKIARADEPDAWSGWQAVGPGELGRPRFNGSDASIHGVYRFQVRLLVAPNPNRTSPAGLNAFRLRLYFENGIMSMPQIFAGRNTIRFKLADATGVRDSIRVTYRYRTASGVRTHSKALRRSDFRENAAGYSFDAPGLLRCESVSISY